MKLNTLCSHFLIEVRYQAMSCREIRQRDTTDVFLTEIADWFTTRDLNSTNYDASRGIVDGRKPAARHLKQFKSGHNRSVEIGDPDALCYLANVDEPRVAIRCGQNAVSEKNENPLNGGSNRFPIFNEDFASCAGRHTSLRSTPICGVSASMPEHHLQC